MKLIRDPIHGYIEPSETQLEIISSPIFQRLRYISQTGLASHIYPGMTHNRFEHSLGVMKASGEMAVMIGRNSGLDIISPGLVQFISTLGMLHDIGHLPFSHTFELAIEMANWIYGMKLNESGRKTHVHIGLKIIEEELSKQLEKVAKETTISDPIKATKHALLNEPTTEEERLSSYIISSSIDADRSDYLLRDSYYAGVVYGLFDLERLKRTLVYKEGRVEVLEKGIPIAEEFLLGRAHMYQNVYFHSVVGMYNAILALAIANILKSEIIKIPESSTDLLSLTDFKVLNLISLTQNKFSKAILFRKGFRRDKDLELTGECARKFEKIKTDAMELISESEGSVIFHEFSDVPEQEPLSLFVSTKNGSMDIKKVSRVASSLGRLDKVILFHQEDVSPTILKSARDMIDSLRTSC